MVYTAGPSEATPPGAGHSSYELIEPEKLLAALPLRPGITVLDLGCGKGDYTLALAEALKRQGLIYALDLWKPGLESLEEKAAKAGFHNIRSLQVDIGKLIPLEDHSIDLALMATVLHDLVEFAQADGALKEAHRVLKPGGVLAVLEFDKVEGPPGPPLRVRLTPEEVENLVTPYGFRHTRRSRVGPHNYMILFVKQ